MGLLRRLWRGFNFESFVLIALGGLGLGLMAFRGFDLFSAIVYPVMIVGGLLTWICPQYEGGLLLLLGVALLGGSLATMAVQGVSIPLFVMIPVGGWAINKGIDQLQGRTLSPEEIRPGPDDDEVE